MNKRAIYSLVAVIIVVIIVIASIAILEYKPTKITSSPTIPPVLLSVYSSTKIANVGQSVQFSATTSGNVSNVLWDFGDGSTGTGLSVTHIYNNPGSYLIFVNATGPGGYSNNLKKLWSISIIPSSINPSLASEISQPTIAFDLSKNPNAPIFLVNSTVYFEASYLQPPSETNWSMAYYIINFGDGYSNITPVYLNTSSDNFLSDFVSHQYTSTGFYSINLTIITYNETPFLKYIVTNNVTEIRYIPTSYYNQVINSGHAEMSFISTIYVQASGQSVGILKPAGNVTNPGVITEVRNVPSGPFSFDPAIGYDAYSQEILLNVYETLVAYNGSSTTQFVPAIAKEIPTISNGGISPNGLNYTFYIRQNLKFSNGDPLNVWDVYTSYVRTLLFMLGTPGTPGWILAQDLLPGGGYLPGSVSYENITKAMSINNATQSITFHLLKPDPAFLDYLADPCGGGITDYNWLVQHGAGIEFTPAGFNSYMNYSLEVNYNEYVRWNTVGSGPYMIGTYLTGQSILLIPNPYYTPISGYPGFNSTPTDKIYIEWIKDPETAMLMLTNSQADIVTNLPNTEFPTLLSMESEGKLNLYTFPSLSIHYFNFNWNVNESMMKGAYGNQYHLPFNYFANPLVRRAFAYSFNYTNYLNKLVGNSIYHVNFGFNYTGIIPKGMPGYVSPEWLQSHGANVPTYNLTLAKQYMEESGLYNTSVNIPIIIYSGDPVDYAASAMWAQNLSAMDPNIQASPVYQPFAFTFGYLVPNQNPMPIYLIGWTPDYPYPSDYVNPMYLQGGMTPVGNGMNYTNLMTWGYYQEAQQWKNMTNLIIAANNATNESLALQYFDEAEVIAVNLTLYVYTYQENEIWIYSPYIHGVQYEENPMFGGSLDSVFMYLTKG